MKRLLMFGAIACASFVATASASVVGNLTLANCAGGGVSVTLNTITWTPISTAPALAGYGCVDTGIGTTLTYNSGTPLGLGTVGDIHNLVLSPPTGGDQFITFPTVPALDFVLTSLFLTSTPTNGTNCASTTTAAGNNSCIVNAASPFLLTNGGASGTTVTLGASGTITNGGVTSNWIGQFTTQLSDSVVTVENTINTGGAESATISDSFTASVVPEPGTITMMLVGGALMAFSAKKRKKV